jgi:predicted Rossmann-fold nucleotide-binding protein
LVAGGKATGIMPRALVDREIAHQGLTTLHIVDTMHERKTMMSDLSDGFIALPGGAAPSKRSSSSGRGRS